MVWSANSRVLWLLWQIQPQILICFKGSYMKIEEQAVSICITNTENLYLLQKYLLKSYENFLKKKNEEFEKKIHYEEGNFVIP